MFLSQQVSSQLLHRTLLDEHFRIKGRETFYEGVEQMQVDLDTYLVYYHQKRPHQGRGMLGRTPYQAFKKGLPKRRRQTRKPVEKEAA